MDINVLKEKADEINRLKDLDDKKAQDIALNIVARYKQEILAELENKVITEMSKSNNKVNLSCIDVSKYISKYYNGEFYSKLSSELPNLNYATCVVNNYIDTYLDAIIKEKGYFIGVSKYSLNNDDFCKFIFWDEKEYKKAKLLYPIHAISSIINIYGLIMILILLFMLYIVNNFN